MSNSKKQTENRISEPLNADDELRDVDQQILSEDDPVSFIDLLAAKSFFAGNLGGKMPVSETREVFMRWLEADRKKHELQARTDENRLYLQGVERHYFPASPSDPYIPLVQFSERIEALKRGEL